MGADSTRVLPVGSDPPPHFRPAPKRDGEFSGFETMDTKLFEDYQKQMMDFQKKWFDTWMDSLSNLKDASPLSEGFEQTLKMQEEIVNSYLDTQKQTNQMMLDAQKQLWSEYFKTMKKSLDSDS
jgi:vacuolar-type H+-ATPase catalytic subunit A/Vma1